MMKYATPLYMDNKNSRSVILTWVQPGSTVLEFGCAYGQMTEYMQKQLGCRVYIVEYNAEAFREALSFAEDGVCGDIQAEEWVTKFADVRFDYILFVDVLEHLSNPLKAMTSARKLLKKGGELLLSIPNVAHNDIINKLFHDRFDYTSEGLLDETHIHLFAWESVVKMIEEAGCRIKTLDYTLSTTGTTEQRDAPWDIIQENLWNEHRWGEIYQFLIKAVDEEDYVGQEISAPDCEICGSLYFDCGSDFCEEDRFVTKAKRIGTNQYRYEETFSNLKQEISRFRYDMLEGQSCYLDCLNVEIRDSDGQTKEKFELKAQFCEGSDPWVMVPLVASVGDSVSVESVFTVEGALMLTRLVEKSHRDEREINQLKTEKKICEQSIAQLETEQLACRQNMVKLNEEQLKYREDILKMKEEKLLYESDAVRLQGENHKYQEEIVRLEKENESHRNENIELRMKISDLESKQLQDSEIVAQTQNELEHCQYERDRLNAMLETEKERLAQAQEKLQEMEKEKTGRAKSLREKLSTFISG